MASRFRGRFVLLYVIPESLLMLAAWQCSIVPCPEVWPTRFGLCYAINAQHHSAAISSHELTYQPYYSATLTVAVLGFLRSFAVK